MEIPEQLKHLYRHWDIYTKPIEKYISAIDVFENRSFFEDISWFINERIKIWKKKTNGEAMPFTDDPILSRYRFCNIYREFDRQTIKFHTLLNPLRENFPLWLLNMYYCRLVAQPKTIEKAGLLSLDEEDNKKVYRNLLSLPSPKFGTPYVFPISTIQKSQTPTRELFITQYLPLVMLEISELITTWNQQSVYGGVETILPVFGFNQRFLWTEVLIDIAYQYPLHIDLFARFPVGPGALPTIQKINSGIEPSQLVSTLSRIHCDMELVYKNKPLRLSAENWEGIACEYRKYMNLKAGRGRKRLYTFDKKTK